ncbi:beta-hexosaminidase subunit beta-like isoform X2 [Brevipalpus obovatus]|uniref:beta-hexosaminidase subunit beta-like isoform X2 n=1 Tax=Brevipalpus obovatus TaxID=246614 RepID=UPI003D9EAB7A
MNCIMLFIVYLLTFIHFSYCEVKYIEIKAPLKGERSDPGSPWPLPRSWTRTIATLTLAPDTFELKSAHSKDCDIIEQALLRYRGLIFDQPSSTKISPNHRELESMRVTISDTSCGYPKLGDDEHYTLSIPSYSHGATIKAKTVWGALRALETFSQLVFTKNQDGHNYYLINATTIEDWPRFSYRGLHIDTARHFIPVNILLKNLEAMAYNKLNVFHWHISDDQSFPLESKLFPNLTQTGAYSPAHIYRQSDVRRIISEARLRGIRVIPEIDTPGHTQSFGKAFPKLLTACYVGDEPFQAKYNVHGEAEILNPSRNYTYQFFKDLFTEIRGLFRDEYIHLGMDEVYPECWESNPEIREFMNLQNLRTMTELEQYYARRTIATAKQIGYKYMIWQDPLDKGVQVSNDTIVQVWKSSDEKRNWQDDVRSIARKRHQVIVSSCWYLNKISYGPDWIEYYKCDPRSLDEKEYVIGGEACMWTEYVDQTNILSRIWPRASAVAERLWSHPRDTNSTDDAQFRLDEHRCRMLRRGIPAQPIGPGFCGPYDLTSNANSIISSQNQLIVLMCSLLVITRINFRAIF